MGNLSIGVHGEFQLGTLLGEQVNWPLGCCLAVSKDYYLIQADLVQKDSNGLDVPMLLNATFGCSLPSGYLVVDAAGFFTFGRFKEGQDRKSLAEIFPTTTLPLDIATTITPMDNTAGLWLVLNLETIDIFNHLLEIGVKGQPNQLALYALLNNQKSTGENFQNLTLCARFPDIKLLNHLTFSNLFFMLQAQSGKNKSFLLRGNITVDLFGKIYLFQGSLSADSKILTAQIRSDQGQHLETLFGGEMPGVAFTDLSLVVSHRFKDSEPNSAEGPEPPCKPGTSLIQLIGKVRFAGLELDGELRLIEGKPALARLSLTHALTLSAFFKQSIPGCTWPEEGVFDLQIKEKSEVYYVQPGLPAGTIPSEYRDGFNIQAHISLTLRETLEFSLRIHVQKDGITASLDMEKPIDLFIIQIAGQEGKSGPNFGLNISQKRKSIIFHGNISFFQKECGNITVTCSKNNNGMLKINGDIQIKDSTIINLIGNKTLNFSYDNKKGLSLKGWNSFFFAESRIDFAAQLKKWAQGGRSGLCKAINNFINKDLLKTTFSIAPSFVTKDVDNKKVLYMHLSGYYLLSMHDEIIVNVIFPDIISFRLPEKLEWEAVPNAIGQALVDAMPSLLHGIVSNSQNLAKVLFALMGKEAGKMAGTLLCRNLIDKAIADALTAAATALAEEYGGNFAAGLGSLLALIASMTGGQPPKPKPDPSDPPDRPENLVAVAAQDTSGQAGVFFSWSPAPLAEKYRASLYDIKGSPLGEQTVHDGVQRVFFPVTAKDPTAGYRLSVAAQNNDKWSNDASYTVYRLICTQPRATYEGEQSLHLTWNPSTGGTAQNYEVTIRTEQRTWMEKSETTSLVLNLDSLENTATHYNIAVRACSILPSLNSENSPELLVSRLSPCNDVQIALSGEKVQITWTPPPAADNCTLHLHAERSGNDWTGNTNASGKEYRFALSLDEGSGRFSISLAVRPRTGTCALPSLWSEKVSVFRSWASLAVLAHDKAMSATACADLLFRDKPKATLPRIACCLAHGGYPAEETAPALRHIYTSVSPVDTARALRHAQYSRKDAGKGLKAAWPDLPDTELTAALDAAYGASETLEQAAARAFAEGLDGAACGVRLIHTYPKTETTDLAVAMATVGYAAKETAAGLMAVWPDLNLIDLTAALLIAYGTPTIPE